MSIFIDKKLWKEIGQQAGWLDVKNIKTAEVEYDKILVDMGSNSVPIPSNVKRRINNAIGNLGNYHSSIPFEEIARIFEDNGCVIIQEDGTKWAGFIAPTGYCGETNGDGSSKNEPMSFDIAIKKEDGWKLANTRLYMTACKMPSEKIEIVAYVG